MKITSASPIWGLGLIASLNTKFSAAPQLSIVLDPDLSTVTVSWPFPAEGWVLEWTDALPDVPAPWVQIRPPYQTSGNRLEYTEPMPGGFRFYRLNNKAAAFSLDPAQSRLTLSGSAYYKLAPAYGGLSGSAPFEEQGPGSLETGFTGILLVHVMDSTITFTGGSEITALDSGSWQPGINGQGAATNANYGAHAEKLLLAFDVALRNLKLDPTSAVLPLAGDTFDPSEIEIQLPTDLPGQADYRITYASASLYSLGKPLSGVLTNLASAAATLTEAGGVQTLMLPIGVEVQVPYTGSAASGHLDVHLAGQLVATRTNAIGFRVR